MQLVPFREGVERELFTIKWVRVDFLWEKVDELFEVEETCDPLYNIATESQHYKTVIFAQTCKQVRIKAFILSVKVKVSYICLSSLVEETFEKLISDQSYQKNVVIIDFDILWAAE